LSLPSWRTSAGVPLTDAIQVVIWLEALSLSFWAGLAAWYAGLRGRALALSLLAGLVVSMIVLLLQVLLSRARWPTTAYCPPAEPSGAVALAIRESAAARLRFGVAIGVRSDLEVP
jgi:hypothetical protein